MFESEEAAALILVFVKDGWDGGSFRGHPGS